MLRSFALTCFLFCALGFGHAQAASSASRELGGDASSISRLRTSDFTNMPSMARGNAMNVAALGAGMSEPAEQHKDAASAVGTQSHLAALTPAQRADYQANGASQVFGANLFTGAFAYGSSVDFNPGYVISVGDQLRVRMWGGYEFDSVLTVDQQGNIFLPHVGPLHVAGVTNSELQPTVTGALRKVFSSRVSVYCNLQMAQPVRVYVAGFVRHPGMYNGTSNDSVLRYLDQAGGIDPNRGSFLDVQIKRGEQVRGTIDLYDFLLRGTLPSVPLADGDVIFVGPRHSTVSVTGLAENAKQIEFLGDTTPLGDIIAAAHPQPSATHVRITRNTGPTLNVEYVALADAANVRLQNGDVIAFTADKQPGTITVRVEGEHLGPQEYVLPYGSRLGSLLQRVSMTERSDLADIQLFRPSVKLRQKQMLDSELNHLAEAVLTARSGTQEEAALRKDEASLVLQWVERAKHIQPLGQTVVGKPEIRDQLLLENGDVLFVPVKDGLVLVGGEVLFPTAIAADSSYSVEDYIAKAGGFSQDADTSRVVVAHLDGTFSDGKRDKNVVAGDQIMVLPKVDFKTRQFAKDVFQILYQIAISAKVALGL
ncbi:polysaccharide biosynthesis/export family protein [Caballeronia sp. GaOx3]|uniref:polysaccharide biosynthesis/export family protein n=1 Tax=Caballeronia sp. GaOx3 TaxID=2921740 RepID=UPI002027C9D5|nr:polysaccharide biosynthesis/export family protein [Caballeronia sp. GaOx3]